MMSRIVDRILNIFSGNKNKYKDVGILLIHGYAGTRGEVSLLYDTLISAGLNVFMPLLAGHEGTKEELAITKNSDWIKSAEDAYIRLNEKYRKIIVIGFSMGGLIGINLYMKYKFDMLITVNTPVYYGDAKNVVTNLAIDFEKYLKFYTEGLDKLMAAFPEFQKLLTKTKPMIKELECKMLIVQTRDDDVVYNKSADYIYKNAKGEKDIKYYDKGSHLVFTRPEGKEVAEYIKDYIIEVIKKQR